RLELLTRTLPPALSRRQRRLGGRERLREQFLLAARREQRIGRGAQRRPGWPNVDQSRFAGQTSADVADDFASPVDSRRLFGQPRAGLDQSIKQLRHLRSLRVYQTAAQQEERAREKELRRVCAAPQLARTDPGTEHVF